MTERHISEQEVEETLGNPEISYTDRKGNPIYVGRPGGRRIKVVVAKDLSPLVVITVAD